MTANPDPTANRPSRWLDRLEQLGNRLPDPVVLFLFVLLAVWAVSALLAPVQFPETDPRTVVRDAAGHVTAAAPIRVVNQLTPAALTQFLARMVKTFVEFPPLGIVLVAMLGVGVAERTGFITAGLKVLLRVTPRRLLVPALLLAAIISHSAADCGFVLIVPLGGLLFAAAGRHPVAGICCAFAGVSGGYSASFLPTTLDPLLQSFTQSAAQLVEPGRLVSPLGNWYFTSVSSGLLILLGWWLTERVIEPRLARVPVDGLDSEAAALNELTTGDRRGFFAGLATFAGLVILLVLATAPAGSPLRGKGGSLTAPGAPLIEAIVPLLCLFFLVPGIVHGVIAGTVKNHRDIVAGMGKSIGSMSTFLVMAFAAAQFSYAFRESNLGALLAVKGTGLLQSLHVPPAVTLVGVVLISAFIDLFIGSASAKWALLAPVFVPMLMQVGLPPELTQAAFRVGSSSTNVITPLMTYFPLVVVFCQRYVRQTGIGTLISLMLPYSMAYLALWTSLLLGWWAMGWPLGL
ncbi:MAG TPA: AbgT family transporter [Candidatus Limnocylindria bacterium]|nr:AbgT family transporter [Candidatus Limnocylindria bacterium]